MEYYEQMLRKKCREKVRAVRFRSTAILRIANVNFLMTPTVAVVVDLRAACVQHVVADLRVACMQYI